MRDLVSVVLPTYNHELFVERALRSVLEQTHASLELIVVDDGSTDQTLARVREVVAGFQRFPVRVFERPHGGSSDAIAFGVAQARGGYLSLLNSDDWYAPTRVETLLQFARLTKAELVFSAVAFRDAEGRPVADEHSTMRQQRQLVPLALELPSWTYGLLAAGNFFMSTGNLFFTRPLWRQLGGFSSDELSHDMDFFLRAARRREPVRVPEELYFYRLHAGNSFWSLEHLIVPEGESLVTRTLASRPARNPAFPRHAASRQFGRRFAATYSPWFRPEGPAMAGSPRGADG